MSTPGTTYLPAEIGWNNWRSFFTDQEMWRPVVAAVCHSHDFTCSQVEAGYPGSCAVFVVDDRLVVKLYPPMLSNDFNREQEVYRLLEGRLDAIPQLLATGIYHDRIDWPYLVLQFCAGEAIRELYQQGTWQVLSETCKEEIARTLGKMLRVVHETPLNETVFLDSQPSAWQAFIAERRLSCLVELRRKTTLPKKVVAGIEMFLAEILPSLSTQIQPCLIHGDLTEDHLLLVKEDEAWRLSALIDWADTEAGVPDYEWVALWFGLCRQDATFFYNVLRAYNPGLHLDPSFRYRVMAYTFLHRFGPAMIADILQRQDNPPVHSLANLQHLLWPHL